MTAPSTSARQAAVDAAANALVFGAHPEQWEQPSKLEFDVRQALDAAFAALAGDLFIDENGVCDTRGGLHLVRDDTSVEMWALLEAILPNRDERQA
jgi:hypothetical protein